MLIINAQTGERVCELSIHLPEEATLSACESRDLILLLKSHPLFTYSIQPVLFENREVANHGHERSGCTP